MTLLQTLLEISFDAQGLKNLIGSNTVTHPWLAEVSYNPNVREITTHITRQIRTNPPAVAHIIHNAGNLNVGRKDQFNALYVRTTASPSPAPTPPVAAPAAAETRGVSIQARQLLAEFLLDRFTSDELRRFIRRGGYGESELPGSISSRASLADAAADLLIRNNAVNDALFQNLRDERPRFASGIEALRRAFQGKPAAAAPSTPVAPPPVAAPAAAETRGVSIQARQLLVDFLLARFSSDELRRFIRRGGYGESELPGSISSRASLADAAADLLIRNNAVNNALFQNLRDERPGAADDIEALRRAFQGKPTTAAPSIPVEPPPAGATVPPPPPTVSTPPPVTPPVAAPAAAETRGGSIFDAFRRVFQSSPATAAPSTPVAAPAPAVVPEPRSTPVTEVRSPAPAPAPQRRISDEDLHRGLAALTDIFGDMTTIRRIMDRVAYDSKDYILRSLPSGGSATTLAYRFVDVCKSHGIMDQVLAAALQEFSANEKLQSLAVGRGLVVTASPTPVIAASVGIPPPASTTGTPPVRTGIARINDLQTTSRMTALTDIFGNSTTIRQIVDGAQIPPRSRNDLINGIPMSSTTSASGLAWDFSDACRRNGALDAVIASAAALYPENTHLQLLAADRGLTIIAVATPAPQIPLEAPRQTGGITRIDQATWIALRDTLSRTIMKKGRIVDIVEDAGLRPEAIDLNGSSITIWYAVFDEAYRSGGASLQRLIAVLSVQPELQGDPNLAALKSALGMP